MKSWGGDGKFYSSGFQETSRGGADHATESRGEAAGATGTIAQKQPKTFEDEKVRKILLSWFYLAHPARFERATFGFVERSSKTSKPFLCNESYSCSPVGILG